MDQKEVKQQVLTHKGFQRVSGHVKAFQHSGPVRSALPLHGGTKCQLPTRSTSDPPKTARWAVPANEAGFESMRKHSFLQHFDRAFEGDPESTGNAKPLA